MRHFLYRFCLIITVDNLKLHIIFIFILSMIFFASIVVMLKNSVLIVVTPIVRPSCNVSFDVNKLV